MATLSTLNLPTAVDGCGVAAWESVLFVVWTQQGTDGAAHHLRASTQRMLAKYPRMAAIHYVVQGLPLPETSARKLLANLVTEFGDLGPTAIVISGSGFWTSAVRSLVTGIFLLAGRRVDAKMFETMVAAVDWTAQQSDFDRDRTKRLHEVADLVLASYLP